MQENKQQLQAIRHGDGPCMVLAGPGSGKTTVITKRVCYMVDELGIPPEKILVITFTKAAAEEMKGRFARLYGNSSGVSFGTFHALFFKIIKYAYRYDSSSILTEEERYRFIREAAEHLKLEGRESGDFTNLISGEISQCKNNEKEPSGFNSTVVASKDFDRLFNEFCLRLKNEGKLDFDDMMVKCLQLFKESPETLQYWQSVYEYILIDEFQDICPLQYRLIKLLAEPEGNLFIVGDDDQSIYAFRGAEPQICFEFEKEFKHREGFEKISLGVNYRCGAKIVDAAKQLISHNKKRYKKLLEAGKKGLLEDEGSVVCHTFPSLEKQNEYVAKMLRILSEQGTPLGETAVLFRTNTQPGNLVSVLRKENIPFLMRDSIRNIFEHWITKNILSYLRLAEEMVLENGKTDRNDLLSILNRPKRYISRECMRRENVSFATLYADNRGKEYVTEKLDKLKYDLTLLSKLNPYAGIRYIRKAVGYEDYLKEYAESRQLDYDELLAVLDELENSVKDFRSLKEWETYISEYSEQLKKKAREKKERDNTEEAVHLMTFHSAKGLEFDVVFIVDVCEDFMPYWQAETTAQIEEERRMFYVAMTRARRRLYLLSPAERFGREFEVSRFIKESGF